MSVIDPTVPHVQAPRRALATGILIFAAFMDLIDVTIVNVALPSIRDDLHATPAHLEWVLSGYTLTFAVLLITGGRLGDNFGRRTMFLLGVGGFTLASLGACLASNGDMLVVARVVQGGFAAMMVPQMLSSVQVLYAPAGARRGVRRRRRGQRYGGRDRPAPRRLADHPRRVRDRLAQHLPDQHPGRPGDPGAGLDVRARTRPRRRRRRSTCPAYCWRARRCSCSSSR